jgi:hypothetical protein
VIVHSLAGFAFGRTLEFDDAAFRVSSARAAEEPDDDDVGGFACAGEVSMADSADHSPVEGIFMGKQVAGDNADTDYGAGSDDFGAPTTPKNLILRCPWRRGSRAARMARARQASAPPRLP